jgi:hypothetical protein
VRSYLCFRWSSLKDFSALARAESVHAVLFYGTDGADHFVRANELARLWICDNFDPDDANGAVFDRGNHTDFVRVTPMGASRIIKIGQIDPRPNEKEKPSHTPVREFARMGPLRAQRKVVLIEEAERMNPDSANALLKLLEEPPPYLKFVLVTNAISRVLPTILSRCVVFGLEAPKVTRMPDDLRGIIPHLADPILNSPEREAQFEELLKLVGKPTAALRLSEDVRDFAQSLANDNLLVREAQARVIEAMACVVQVRHPERPEWTQMLLVAHRYILGNITAPLVLDATFAKMR